MDQPVREEERMQRRAGRLTSTSQYRKGPPDRASTAVRKGAYLALKKCQKGPIQRPLWHTQWSLPGTAGAKVGNFSAGIFFKSNHFYTMKQENEYVTHI